IEVGPTLPNAYTARGEIRQDKGQLDEALADYAKAIEVAPAFAYGDARRGLVLLQQGKDEPAQRDFDKARELNPSDSFRSYQVGQTAGGFGFRKMAKARAWPDESRAPGRARRPAPPAAWTGGTEQVAA